MPRRKEGTFRRGAEHLLFNDSRRRGESICPQEREAKGDTRQAGETRRLSEEKKETTTD